MKARFYISRHVCKDSTTRWFGVFDRHSATEALLLPCCLRKTRRACQTWIDNTRRELKTDRQFNRRRRARIARIEASNLHST
jgi:hypothetical protein